MPLFVYKTAILAVLTIFYAAYLLKQLLLLRKGIKSDRLGKGDKPEGTRQLEAALKAVTFIIPVVQYLSALTDNSILPLVAVTPNFLKTGAWCSHR